ncbi:MAG: valine--tRNA ligase [Ardenticatenaceae bacterium]|nr:valine--tRNA ligase [Ardenticatenaceae bacterium]MCB9003880.1 valine--tRNA ligase [Ardenticatenaceae bacterium]
MTLPKRYNPHTTEPQLQALWQEQGTYHFDPASSAPVYSIDTPPPTVSGNLHLGHVYSYSHADFFARFWRMNGCNVYYPMGYDANGLPTERLVEKWEGIHASDIGREAFIRRCLAVSAEAEKEYQALWQRMGLSIDWRYSYRTIDDQPRRLAQWSFLDLYEKGLAYRQKAPSIWCPECQTAIAQAELNDLERASTFYTLDFRLEDGQTLPIATTRPELLPACVAVFVHPEDGRFQHLIHQQAIVPHFKQRVPILADPDADPQKGSGAVMCCTFGDTADVTWWHTHQLPLIEAIGRDGRMTDAAAEFAGLSTSHARQQIVAALAEAGLLLGQEPITQSVRVHERCDTPVEYIVTGQWFIRILQQKEAFLQAGEQITWQPPHMQNRYRQWVENLGWDWCISRQRYFGVTFPLWYCANCGEVLLAELDDLPIDPTTQSPKRPCPHCGSTQFHPESDVMDTWFTSSLTPQIVGQWPGPDGDSDALYRQVFPFSLRPQAHEIIRTWAFYTIVKSHYHFDALPWQTVAISGWGLAPEGSEKLSKSKGGGAASPMDMITQHSADAVRYWTASTSLGKDAHINEERVQAGAKLVNKLWHVSRFCSRFLDEEHQTPPPTEESFTPADRWILARTQQLIQRVTKLFENYDYATAKSEVEVFFWRDLADNYLEMAKQRLYEGGAAAAGARFALSTALLTTLKLFAPILPYVTEHIYQHMFATFEGTDSIHRASWPQADERWLDEDMLRLGEALIEIATAVRRFKSEHNLSLGTELAQLHISTHDLQLDAGLQASAADLLSITRAGTLHIKDGVDGGLAEVIGNGRFTIAVMVDKPAAKSAR